MHPDVTIHTVLTFFEMFKLIFCALLTSVLSITCTFVNEIEAWPFMQVTLQQQQVWSCYLSSITLEETLESEIQVGFREICLFWASISLVFACLATLISSLVLPSQLILLKNSDRLTDWSCYVLLLFCSSDGRGELARSWGGPGWARLLAHSCIVF